MSDLNKLKKDPNLYVHDIIVKLKNETDLIREKFKLEIDEKAKNIIQQLDNYEKECVASFNANEFKNKMAKFDKTLDQTTANLVNWQNTLNNLEIDQKIWKEIKEKSVTGVNNLNDLFKDLKNQLLLEKFYNYHSIVVNFTNVNLKTK